MLGMLQLVANQYRGSCGHGLGRLSLSGGAGALDPELPFAALLGGATPTTDVKLNINLNRCVESVTGAVWSFMAGHVG